MNCPKALLYFTKSMRTLTSTDFWWSFTCGHQSPQCLLWFGETWELRCVQNVCLYSVFPQLGIDKPKGLYSMQVCKLEQGHQRSQPVIMFILNTVQQTDFVSHGVRHVLSSLPWMMSRSTSSLWTAKSRIRFLCYVRILKSGNGILGDPPNWLARKLFERKLLSKLPIFSLGAGIAFPAD